jgi:hypothetical protein
MATKTHEEARNVLVSFRAFSWQSPLASTKPTKQEKTGVTDKLRYLRFLMFKKLHPCP